MKLLLQTLFFFLLATHICFGQWVQVGLNDETIKDIAVQNQNIFAVTSDSCGSWPSMLDPCLGKLYRSTDNGLNWTMLVDSNVLDVAISTSGKIFKIEKDSVNQYGGLLPNLYYSLDNGNNWIWSDIEWQLIDSLLLLDFEGPEKITISPEGFVYCNIVDEFSDEEGKKSSAHCKITEALGMPDWRDNIARSTDDGVTWSTPGKSVIGGEQFYFKDNLVLTVGHLDISGIPFGGLFSLIFISPDYGNSWNHICTGPGLIWNHVLTSFSNNNIFSDADNILYLSTDTCNTWTPIATLNIQAGLCWSSGSTEGMLIGTDSLGVFLFSDVGDSLGSRNEGLTNLNIHSFTLGDDGYVYAGTENGVWRRPLSEVTSVDNELTQPIEFILEQNYPNPFNPITTIQYSIPQRSSVTLKVYDVLGNEIAELVNEEKGSGVYSVNFDASGLASGLYLYRLQAGSFVETRKMLLLK